jgi:hypothetical protein
MKTAYLEGCMLQVTFATGWLELQAYLGGIPQLLASRWAEIASFLWWYATTIVSVLRGINFQTLSVC